MLDPPDPASLKGFLHIVTHLQTITKSKLFRKFLPSGQVLPPNAPATPVMR